MMLTADSDGYSVADAAVADLLRALDADLSPLQKNGIPLPHTGDEYRRAAIQLIKEARAFEKRNTEQIVYTAKKLTSLCEPGWEKNKLIIQLFQKVACAVTRCSDYPDLNRRVGALNLGPDGELLAFGTNAIPVGPPLCVVNHNQRQRNKFRNCAEITTLARRLGLSIQLDDPHYSGLIPSRQEEGEYAAEIVNRAFRQSIREEGAKSALFSDNYLVVTIPPCESCSDTILNVGVGGLIIPPAGAEHLERPNGLKRLEDKINIIFLPNLGRC